MNRHRRRAARREGVQAGDVIAFGRAGRRDREPGGYLCRCYFCDGPISDWPWPGGPVEFACGVIQVGEDPPQLICRACHDDQLSVAQQLMPEMEFTDISAKTPQEVQEIVSALREREDSGEPH
jgi:hypothetical protein